MSYILDALKKAERERGIARMPTLATIHELRKVRRHYPWIITGAIVLSAAAIIWFYLPSSKTATKPQILTQTGTESNGGIALPSTETGETSVPVKAPQPTIETPEAEPLIPTAISPPSKPELPAYEVVTSKSAESESEASDSGEAEVVSQETDQDSSIFEDSFAEELLEGDDSDANAPELDQNPTEAKPASFREAADRMILNIHVYSESKEERMVFIDGRKYLEGDYVDGQYLLEEITPEGAVLSHKGEKAILRPGLK